MIVPTKVHEPVGRNDEPSHRPVEVVERDAVSHEIDRIREHLVSEIERVPSNGSVFMQRFQELGPGQTGEEVGGALRVCPRGGLQRDKARAGHLSGGRQLAVERGDDGALSPQG